MYSDFNKVAEELRTAKDDLNRATIINIITIIAAITGIIVFVIGKKKDVKKSNELSLNIEISPLKTSTVILCPTLSVVPL
jgi:hypothetical protein